MDFKSMQNAEFDLINSMYNEVTDLRPQQKKWKPLNLKIKLFPQRGSSGGQNVYVSLSLGVHCGARYPEQVPKIILDDGKGLSKKSIGELQLQLEEKAEELKGEVMILELIQITEKFLYENNKPPQPSFYEQMQLDQMQRDTEKMKIREAEEEEQRRQMAEEMEKRKEQLKKDGKTRRNTIRSIHPEQSPSHQSLSSSENSESSPFLRTSSTHVSCLQHKKSEIMCIANVQRRFQKGSCLGHSDKGCYAFSGIDLESGQLVYITEWNFQNSQFEQKKNSIDDFISRIEQEINKLTGLHHKNLISYECVSIVRKKDELVIYVVQDFILGTSVSSITNYLGWASEGASFVAKEVLEALIYLHNNGVMHNSLFDSAVYMDNSGNIRVSDFSLIAYLQNQMGGNKSSYSGDLSALGGLIETLLPTPPSQMRDFIERCRSKRTLSGSELLDHPFLRPNLYSEPKEKDLEQYRPPVERPISTPLVPMIVSPEKSRLKSEFQFMVFLGKGAYGDVIKMRNILDDKEYAIKKILLHAKSQQIIRKMTREVKLLSKLNHENVVRYYNSWIESAGEDDKPRNVDGSEWSLSEESRKALVPKPVINEPSSSKSSSDWIDYKQESSSDGIEFVDSKGNPINYENDDHADESPQEISKRPFSQNETMFNVLYIQMEFCEKSTLRSAIDSNLYEEVERLWRLFREICEGLQHIHQQGIIHRDLKPVNIFLDSRDRVKIGDFGLATTNILALQDSNVTQTALNPTSSATGKVGTALYVAPELSGMASKSTYNQKVDLYSLGIIMFEMSHPPLPTAMERIHIIGAVRKPEIVLPDFLVNNERYSEQTKVIRWLLDHNARNRPNAEELLSSDLLPPPSDMVKTLKQIISTPQSNLYFNMISGCISQESDYIGEITYYPENLPIIPLPCFELIKSKIKNIFIKHGGIEIITPLLTPYIKKNVFCNAVRLMTHSGTVVILPQDLHYPFIRFIAGIPKCHMRRYSIGRVYREEKIFSTHPKQIHECAFDIISPHRGNLIIDAELLMMAFDLVNECPTLKKRNISFRINHTDILKAILQHCNVPSSQQSNVISIVNDFIDGKCSKFQVINSFKAILNSKSSTNLADLLCIDVPIQDIENTSALKSLLKGRTETAQIVKRAFKELESVTTMATSLGVTCSINIVTGFQGGECFKSKSGAIVWQMNCESGKIARNKCKIITLATGGRYDSKLSEHTKTWSAYQGKVEPKTPEISGAGFSFALDKICLIIQQSEQSKFASIDVVVCVIGSRPPQQDVTQILRGLWNAKIRAAIIESSNPDEAFDLGKKTNAQHMILMAEGGNFRVQSWEKNQYKEQSVTRPDVIAYIQKTQSSSDILLNEITGPSSHLPQPITPNTRQTASSTSTLQIEFLILATDKLSVSKKRRYETQIQQNLLSTLSKLAAKQRVVIYAVDLPTNIVRELVAAIDPVLNDTTENSSEIKQLFERFPKQKKYLQKIYDEVQDTLTETKNTSIVGLYSFTDNFYRLLL